jgi:hypothetical protein
MSVSAATGADEQFEGKRKIAAMGSVGHNTSWTLTLPAATYYWSVQAVDAGFEGSPFAPEQEFAITATDAPRETELPEAFQLSQNYPNPFNPGTIIRYQVPETERVTIVIYNMRGQKVITLLDEAHVPGHYAASWDGRGAGGEPVASGPYIYVMRAGSFSAARTMILFR